MKIFEGLTIGFLMGASYLMVLRLRTRFIFGKKYLYYIGWIISLAVFSFVFLFLNKRIAFDMVSFLIGIFIAQISIVSFYFFKSQKNDYIDQ
jgi:amino acid permease